MATAAVALASSGMSGTNAVLLAERERGLAGVPRAPPARRRVHGLRGGMDRAGARPRRAAVARRRDRGGGRSLPPAPGRRAGSHLGPERAGDRVDRARCGPDRRGCARSRAARTTSFRVTSTSSCSHGSGRSSGAPLLGQADVVEAGPLVVDHRARQVRVDERAVRLVRSRVRAGREARERPDAGVHEDRAPARRVGDPGGGDPHADGRLARVAAPPQARGGGRRRTSSSTTGAWAIGCSCEYPRARCGRKADTMFGRGAGRFRMCPPQAGSPAIPRRATGSHPPAAGAAPCARARRRSRRGPGRADDAVAGQHDRDAVAVHHHPTAREARGSRRARRARGSGRSGRTERSRAPAGRVA